MSDGSIQIWGFLSFNGIFFFFFDNDEKNKTEANDRLILEDSRLLGPSAGLALGPREAPVAKQLISRAAPSGCLMSALPG